MTCQICFNQNLNIRTQQCAACDFESTMPAGMSAKRRIQRAVLAHHAGDSRAAVWLRREHYYAYHREDWGTEELLRRKGFDWIGGAR